MYLFWQLFHLLIGCATQHNEFRKISMIPRLRNIQPSQVMATSSSSSSRNTYSGPAINLLDQKEQKRLLHDYMIMNTNIYRIDSEKAFKIPITMNQRRSHIPIPVPMNLVRGYRVGNHCWFWMWTTPWFQSVTSATKWRSATQSLSRYWTTIYFDRLWVQTRNCSVWRCI